MGSEIQDSAAQVVVGMEIQDLAAQAAEDLAALVEVEVSVTLDLVAQAVDMVTQGLVAQVVVVLVLVVPVDLGILAQVDSVAALVVLALVVLAIHLKAGWAKVIITSLTMDILPKIQLDGNFGYCSRIIRAHS